MSQTIVYRTNKPAQRKCFHFCVFLLITRVKIMNSFSGSEHTSEFIFTTERFLFSFCRNFSEKLSKKNNMKKLTVSILQFISFFAYLKFFSFYKNSIFFRVWTGSIFILLIINGSFNVGFLWYGEAISDEIPRVMWYYTFSYVWRVKISTVY